MHLYWNLAGCRSLGTREGVVVRWVWAVHIRNMRPPHEGTYASHSFPVGLLFWRREFLIKFVVVGQISLLYKKFHRRSVRQLTLDIRVQTRNTVLSARLRGRWKWAGWTQRSVGGRVVGCLSRKSWRSVRVWARLTGRLMLLRSGVWTSAPLCSNVNFRF